MADIEIKAMVNAGIPEDVATGWVVKGYIVGSRSFVLTYVNEQKVGNKYSLFDYVCFLLLFLIIAVVIYKLINRLL
ncbi:hypothetical protein MT996_04320 [Ornithobacterium rhinotracheale]|uniref:hypothetical protein n=1 Tax=Ornithobacterium rhinotracheale TaxID=28251 RepID=UPI00129C1F22|nr:hypothetical protein [Ornithobacterium rhinotracheale]UOH78699.1 hypothetical protein MT996_04320 [Ornithobacterium rhinotracheale]